MLLGRPEPCRPLTRRPGAWAAIPGTMWKVQLFPTQIRLYGPQGQRVLADLPLDHPVEEWTAQLDLDRFETRIWGKAGQPFLFRLVVCSGRILLKGRREKGPSITLTEGVEQWYPSQERLQFGNHALQNVDGAVGSASVAQIASTWFRLGLPLPASEPIEEELSLLGQWASTVRSLERHRIVDAIVQLRKAGFCDLWSPQEVDQNFWGYGLPPTMQNGWHLLASGARLLRKMALQSNDLDAFLLPSMPKELAAGRLLNAHWPGVGTLDLEWTKGSPRRLLLTPSHEETISLRWIGDEARVRPLQGGVPHRAGTALLHPGEPLQVHPGQPLLIDRFFSRRSSSSKG
jgi:hypothetical protein